MACGAVLGERDAVSADLPALMHLVAEVVVGLRQAGIAQWDEVYPDAATISRDLAAGTVRLVHVDGMLAGAVCLNREAMPEYDVFTWAGNDPAIVHRLMVHPRFQGRGLGRRLMFWTEATARTAGRDSLRLDAFQANPAAIGLYPALGFTRIGSVRFRTGWFGLFEKILH